MRVLAVTGSSGGHIFPAIAFLDALKDANPSSNRLLVLPRKNIHYDSALSGHAVSFIAMTALSTRLAISTLRAFGTFIQGSWQSLRILMAFKPDVVVGFGSIASIPMVMAAWFFRIKTVLHEQNVVPGQANRFLARFCDTIAVSFPETATYLTAAKTKIVVTGNPMRASLRRMDKWQAREFFALDGNKFTVLVMGGSQGSQSLNRMIVEALAGFVHKDRIQVIHLTGNKGKEDLPGQYRQIKVPARLFEFLPEMEYALSAADLAVCRAGATTIQELIYYRLPAILVPYPFAYAHQKANARVLADAGCCLLREENQFNADTLRVDLARCMDDPAYEETMRVRFHALAQPDAARLLVRAAME